MPPLKISVYLTSEIALSQLLTMNNHLGVPQGSAANLTGSDAFPNRKADFPLNSSLASYSFIHKSDTDIMKKGLPINLPRRQRSR